MNSFGLDRQSSGHEYYSLRSLKNIKPDEGYSSQGEFSQVLIFLHLKEFYNVSSLESSTNLRYDSIKLGFHSYQISRELMPLFIDCEESKPIELLHFKVCLISRLTLLDAGGGGKRPPSHTFAIPRKKVMGKVANFF